MAGRKMQGFQISTDRLGDTRGKENSPCFRGRESHQSWEISGGVAIGCFPSWAWGSRQDIRNITKLRADLGV